jgi:hypothetical protein
MSIKPRGSSLITRLEPCVKSERAPTRRASPTLIQDVALGVGALGYVLIALFDDVESPLITLLVVVLVAYWLVRPHLRNRQRG